MGSGLPPPVRGLIDELKRLPGVGEKTATRYVLHLLGRGSEGVNALERALAQVAIGVQPCARCGFLADGDTCEFCNDSGRDHGIVCVVEGVADVMAIDKMGDFGGVYHVLGGAISALRGVTPEKLRIASLVARVTSEATREVVVATSASAEGETTALYIRKVLEGRGVKVTRPATGIPMGSSIEYLDGVTLLRAMRARREI